jgi:predicted HTH domain antitoxin
VSTERGREATILELYRIGQITSGRAAHDLGMSRVEFLDLANRHQIPTIQITADELDEEFGSLEL